MSAVHGRLLAGLHELLARLSALRHQLRRRRRVRGLERQLRPQCDVHEHTGQFLLHLQPRLRGGRRHLHLVADANPDGDGHADPISYADRNPHADQYTYEHPDLDRNPNLCGSWSIL